MSNEYDTGRDSRGPQDRETRLEQSSAERVASPTNGFAITALVTSLVLAPLGIVFGHIALKQIARTGESGRGLAIGGLVVGYVFTAIGVIWAVIVIVMISSATDVLDSDATRGAPSTTSTPELQGPLYISDLDADSALPAEGECVVVTGRGNRLDETPCWSSGETKYEVTANYPIGTDPSACPDGAAFRPGTILICLSPASN